MVVAILLIVAAMAIPGWMRMSRTYRLRSDVNRITGMINAGRMRGASTFARVKVDCSQADSTNCAGSSAACTVSLYNYQTTTAVSPTSTTPTPTYNLDSPQQRVCLSTNISFALPSTTYGVQGQATASPTQNTTLYFNSLGFPITISGTPISTYAMYLTEASSGSFMAIGIAGNGKPNVYSLSGSNWQINQ